MRNKKGKSLRKLSWEVGTRVAGAALLVLAFLPMSGCTPDIANDWNQNTDGIMLFDLQAVPPIVPQPTYIAMNVKTGKVDLSQAGITLPPGATWNASLPCAESLNGTCTELQSFDCNSLASEKIASCDVYKYLTSLDGFPTAAPITAQSSKQIDTATVTVGGTTGTLSVFCTDRTNQNDLTKLKIYSNAELSITSNKSQTVADAWDLSISTNPPMNINSNCVVAVRGYENGIKSKDGTASFQSSQTFFLLKEKDSLTCGLTKGDEGLDVCQSNPPALIPQTCKYYSLISGVQPAGTTQIFISGLMCVLEYLRTNMVVPVLAGLDTLTGSTTMSDEAAIAWAFPTHSTPVIEFIPGVRQPILSTDKTQISIQVNGTVASDQIRIGTFGVKGTVFLFDITALQATIPNYGKGLPTFTPSFDNATHQIQLKSINPPVDVNDSYLIFVSKGVDANGKPILTNMVPFMSTVLVTTKGKIYDSVSKTLFVPASLTGLSTSALAISAECNRSQLAVLFDTTPIPSMTGLTRENVLFVGSVGTSPCP